jgi:hypothetical protein
MKLNKKREKDRIGKQMIAAKKIYKEVSEPSIVPIVLSGGTNALSKQLADMVGVRINGVAIGTYARDIVEEFIVHADFFQNQSAIKHAYAMAKSLVDVNNQEGDK